MNINFAYIHVNSLKRALSIFSLPSLHNAYIQKFDSFCVRHSYMIWLWGRFLKRGWKLALKHFKENWILNERLSIPGVFFWQLSTSKTDEHNLWIFANESHSTWMASLNIFLPKVWIAHSSPPRAHFLHIMHHHLEHMMIVSWTTNNPKSLLQCYVICSTCSMSIEKHFDLENESHKVWSKCSSKKGITIDVIVTSSI